MSQLPSALLGEPGMNCQKQDKLMVNLNGIRYIWSFYSNDQVIQIGERSKTLCNNMFENHPRFNSY